MHEGAPAPSSRDADSTVQYSGGTAAALYFSPPGGLPRPSLPLWLTGFWLLPSSLLPLPTYSLLN